MTNKLPPVSPVYRSTLIYALASVFVFFTVYLLLILLALALIVVLGYGAVKILSLHGGYITLVIALGMFGTGLLVFYFLIKFIFSRRQDNGRHLLEISRAQQPKLFGIIDEMVKETGVQAPKKVFLSHEVNACVSYNSLFWSMFLPVRKNLTIGMGLINTVTTGELKTVLAHEFGHFSQKSMKIGGYINQAEKIIFDTVYNNAEFENSVKNSSGHWAFLIFYSVAMLVINIFRFILKTVSEFLFRHHASLRREMEFHADAVATYVTNPGEQISSLMRLELSEDALTRAFLFYTESKTAYLPENLYDNQTALMRILSDTNNYPYKNGFPVIESHDISRYKKSRIEIEDPWTFHPETGARVERIAKNPTINRPENTAPARDLIVGFSETCRVLTRKFLTLQSVKNTGEEIDNETFVKLYGEKFPVSQASLLFNGYYDVHHPVLEDLDLLIHEPLDACHHEFFNDQKITLMYEKAGLESDLSTLQYLKANPKAVKNFRYNGSLYKALEAGILIPRFTKELEGVKEKVRENDSNIFSYFYHKANDTDKDLLKKRYAEFAVLDREYDMFQNSVNHFIPHLQFMTTTLSFEEIRKHRATLLRHEKPFKKVLTQFIEESGYRDLLSIEDKELLKDFIASEYIYFNNDRYYEAEVNAVFTVVNAYQEMINKTYTAGKEALLDCQTGIAKAS